MAESFVFYETFAKQLKLLDKDLRYKFYEAIIEYGLYNTEPNFTGLEACAWLPIQEAISNAKKRRIKNVTDGKKGGRPEISQDIKNSIRKDLENELTQKEIAEKYEISQQTVSNIKNEVFGTKYQKPQDDTKNLDVDVDVDVDGNGNDIGADAPAPGGAPPTESKRFVKPTLAEVAEYCRERGNNVNPERWYAHYESNGWKVGKSPMKDWRAAVITWEHNNFDRPRTTSPPIAGVDSDFDTEAMAAIFNGGSNA